MAFKKKPEYIRGKRRVINENSNCKLLPAQIGSQNPEYSPRFSLRLTCLRFSCFFLSLPFFTSHSPALTFADYLSRSARSRGVVFRMFFLNIRRIFHFFVLLSRLVITPMSDTRWLLPPLASHLLRSKAVCPANRDFISSRDQKVIENRTYISFNFAFSSCAIVKISKHYSIYTVYTFKYAWL